MANEVIVVATSAPTGRPHYRQDLLDCFCSPTGTRARFSYRKRWIDHTVLNQPSRWENVPILIVFCDPVQSAPNEFRFYPLRWGTFQNFDPPEILSSSDPDTYVAVTFELGRFVHLKPNAKEITNRLDMWQLWVKNYSERPKPTTRPQAKDTRFVFPLQDFPEGSEDSQGISWSTLSAQLVKAETLRGCSFYRIAGVRRTGKDSHEISIVEHEHQKGYDLESAKSYIIDLHFYLEPGKILPRKKLKPVVSTESISLSQPLIANIGLSTNESIVLTCDRIYTTEIATLVIEDPEDKESKIARAQFVVVLRPAPWLLTVVIVLLVLGAFFVGVSSDMIKELAAMTSWFYSHASGLSYVIKAIGVFAVGLAGYLGFKKIPSL